MIFFLNPDELEEDTLPAHQIVWVLPELVPVVASIYERVAAKALSVESGRNRNTFFMPGNHVIKLPKTWDGFSDNDWEGSISNSAVTLNNPFCIQYPKTRILNINEIPILLMEKVTPIFPDDLKEKFGTIPDWVDEVDCAQVGLTKRGRLVAFDYGPN